MKRILVLLVCVLFWNFALIGQMSTYVPIESYMPAKPENPGYKDYTSGMQSIMYGRDREGIALLEASGQKGYMPAFRKLGDFYMHKRNLPTLAKGYYQKAADKGDILSMQSLAELYIKENNFPEALKYYQKLVPTHPSVWLTISRIYGKMGETKKAAESFKTFQELHNKQ